MVSFRRRVRIAGAGFGVLHATQLIGHAARLLIITLLFIVHTVINQLTLSLSHRHHHHHQRQQQNSGQSCHWHDDDMIRCAPRHLDKTHKRNVITI